MYVTSTSDASKLQNNVFSALIRAESISALFLYLHLNTFEYSFEYESDFIGRNKDPRDEVVAVINISYKVFLFRQN